jgi:pentatricopeptide repeat protein
LLTFGNQLLAIHPNYLFRNSLLLSIRDEMIDLKDEGKCSVALGLLRDGQNEMALDYWDQLRQDGTDIPNWVSEIFIYVLVMRGFLEEAIEMLHQVFDEARKGATSLPPVLWYYLLDECSRGMHYEGTRFIWDEMVEPRKINPSDGIVLHVLNTAARYGDTALATAAIELLSERQAKLGLHHYEPLLESYAQAGDLEKAFRVLFIMADAGVPPCQSSTRSVFSMLARSPELADEAARVLRELSKGRKVPVAAANVLLEAVTNTGTMSRALEVYHSLTDICKSWPNQLTFELLLAKCTTSAPAVSLVAQMDLLSIRPTPAILDNLIRCFAHNGSLDVAMLYLDEMSRFPAPSPWVSGQTLAALLHRCHKDNDSRALKVASEAKNRGIILKEEALSKLREIGPGQTASGPAEA